MRYLPLYIFVIAFYPAYVAGTDRVLKEHSKGLYCVSYSPDGSTLLSASADGNLIAWDPTTGSVKGNLKNTGFIYRTAFSPDGKFIAVGCAENKLLIVDAKSLKVQYKLEGNSEDACIYNLAYDQAGAILAASSDTSICTFDTKNYQKKSVIQIEGNVCAMALTPDGKRLFYDGVWQLGLLDVATGKSVLPRPKYYDTIFSLAISPDGRLLAIGAPETLSIWDPKELKELLVLEAHKGLVSALAFSSDSKVIASGGQDGLVRLWDAGTGKELVTLKGHTDEVWSVAIRPDGKQVASGSSDNTVRLWDISTIKK